ncbi:alpha/beta family hydrolase [Lysobacter sp. Root494]|uniref:dienelactone hydrolase family protein n=1 Tax=Lysobacter sp. Root494 TaxID=1736549 RepID=UPI000ABCAD97|nr:alpha/beta family hydrolase [Lysobacter sp. Root494]
MTVHSDVDIVLGSLRLQGILGRPGEERGIVVFAHGSGSGRRSPRNQFVATVLNEAGLTTLLFDLLTAEEEERERYTRHLRFDIGLLAERLFATTLWVRAQPSLKSLPIGYFGASTGAAAALVAAAKPGAAMQAQDIGTAGFDIGAVVSRGGRPDLAGAALHEVRAPTLLIVGGDDTDVITLNQMALRELRTTKAIEIVPGAGHLFEEAGTLDIAARLAAQWFKRHLSSGTTP